MVATRERGFCRGIAEAVAVADELGGCSKGNRGHIRSLEWEDRSLMWPNVERKKDENDE